MLCAKCHQNEATVHLTTVEDGAQGEAVDAIDLCEGCSGPQGFCGFDLKQLEALSVIGKKCEFCGKEACSGEMRATGGAIYWCFDCGVELGRIVADLITSERPELMQPSEEEGSMSAIWTGSELRAWSAEATQKAVQVLKDRRR